MANQNFFAHHVPPELSFLVNGVIDPSSYPALVVFFFPLNFDKFKQVAGSSPSPFFWGGVFVVFFFFFFFWCSGREVILAPHHVKVTPPSLAPAIAREFFFP